MNRTAILLGVLGVAFIASLAFATGPIEQAPRIAEMRSLPKQSFWEFLNSLQDTFEAQIATALFCSGFVGMLGSWCWKWSQSSARCLQHFTLKYAFGQFLWLVGSSIAAVMTLKFQTDGGEFFGWISVITTGGLMGFSGELKIPKNGTEARK